MAALLDRSGVVEAMTLAVQERGAPFLGICVGMQLLAREGREFGVTPGLAWIDGEVHRLSPTGRGLKVPHMGWNSLDGDFQGPLWGGLPAGVHMYFTHSYVLSPDERADAAAWTEHGGEFVSAVVKGNVAGVQFHPEKSQGAGARLLGNFLNWRP
jgi:glutamine amidotransferase